MCDGHTQVGDPNQLPATVLTREKTAQLLYRRSVFQRLEEAGHCKHFLDTQYRMHPEIAHFPSRHFYDGRLKTAASMLASGPPGKGDEAASGVMKVSSSAFRSPLQRCRSTYFEFAMGTYVVLDVPFSVVKRSTSKCGCLLPAHSPTLLSTHALRNQAPRTRDAGPRTTRWRRPS